MKKILKNDKAGVPIIAVAIISILIIAGIAFVYINSSSPYWETETDFGMWKEEIEIGYTDGTNVSLKVLLDQKNIPFVVKYQGQEIDFIRYTVRAEATGDYDYARLDTSDFHIDAYVGDEKEYVVWGYSSVDVPTDGSATIVRYNKLIMDNWVEWRPDGEYVITFKSEGIIEYWGYPGGEGDKTTATLPPDRSVVVIKSSNGGGGNIIVTLSSRIEDYYTS